MELKESLRRMLCLTDEDILDCLCREASLRRVDRRESIYKRGEIPEETGLLLSGVVATQLPDIEGRVVIDCIMDEPGTPLLPPSGFVAPSCQTAIALMPSVVAMWPTERLAGLMGESPALMRSVFMLAMAAIRANWEKERALSQPSAQKRYAWFVERHPDFPVRGMNKYIAAYLRMSPETVSRIRSSQRQRQTEGEKK